MLYLPIIEALENQLKDHPQLRKLRYYRFTLPSNSVKAPFICIPWVQTAEYTSHAHPCIFDTLTHSCMGNYWDQHQLEIPILIGAARHKSADVDTVLDILQDAVLKQVLDDRDLGGVCRICEPSEVIVDTFFEISPQFRGAMITIDVKYIDDPVIPDLGQIEYLLDPEYVAIVE